MRSSPRKRSSQQRLRRSSSGSSRPRLVSSTTTNHHSLSSHPFALKLQQIFYYSLSLQTLNNDFRIKYCNLWSSIIERNVEGIKKWARALGTGDLFPLFACMVTGRSWESVSNSGVVEKEFSASEVGNSLLILECLL